jgi:hypothetical protein
MTDNHNPVRGPIFIGGPDRCGKTTLRAFLASHPNISIPAVGSNMWTYFYRRFGDLANRKRFERCLNAMLHYKHVKFLEPDGDRIRREFLAGEPTYARLFALFQRHHCEREAKPRWGDQTGLVERYADEIFTAYPDVKMLHMVRDPRDRYEASLALWPKGKGRVGGATARWLYSTQLGKRNLRRYPGRYKLVRFESLITDTERVLREVCEFLEEDFVPGMLRMDSAPRFREGLGNRSGSQTGDSLLSMDFIGRFRTVMTTAELRFMQSIAGPEMLQFDYDLEPVPMSAGERTLYAFRDLPLNLLRMTAWRSIEAAQQRFPRFVHRSIDPKKRLEPGDALVPMNT